MKIISSYKVKIKHYNHIFDETVKIYRDSVAFFIDVCDKEWLVLQPMNNHQRNRYLEIITHSTKQHPCPMYDFDSGFYKMPSYLRRAAAQQALGCYSSYYSNLMNWQNNGMSGERPSLTLDRHVMPTLYKNNMYVRTGTNTAEIKVFHNNDWIWISVDLRATDVKYITKYCLKAGEVKELSPSLIKDGKRWYLVFPLEEMTDFSNKPIEDQVICAVDLGINYNAVCSIMHSDGTVTARKFVNLASEKDHLDKALGRQKNAQQNGSKKTPTKWKHINDINTDISRKTATAIMEFAISNKCDVIVFEYLDTSGKKRGAKKQKLALWRKKEIQAIVTHQAHRKGIRISRICAWKTSKLAFDGSGTVQRGVYKINGEIKFNYSICVFPNNKTYHCDLNASYNIGARYFIRELLKSESVTAGLPDGAKELRYGTGTTRTLSTLIRLNADLCA